MDESRCDCQTSAVASRSPNDLVITHQILGSIRRIRDPSFSLSKTSKLWLGRAVRLESELAIRDSLILADANVLLHAFFLRTSRSAEVIESCRLGLNALLVTPFVLEEARVVVRSKASSHALDFARWLGVLNAKECCDAAPEEYPPECALIPDADDRYLYAAAVLHAAEYIVTNDGDLAPLSSNVRGVKVVTPAHFLVRPEQEPIDFNLHGAGQTVHFVGNIPCVSSDSMRQCLWDLESWSLLLIGRELRLEFRADDRLVYECKLELPSFFAQGGQLDATASYDPLKGLWLERWDARGHPQRAHVPHKRLFPGRQPSRPTIGQAANGEDSLEGIVQQFLVVPFRLKPRRLQALRAYGDLCLDEDEVNLREFDERIIAIPPLVR